MTTPKLLSPEELERFRVELGAGKLPNHDDGHRLLDHIAAMTARVGELEGALGELFNGDRCFCKHSLELHGDDGCGVTHHRGGRFWRCPCYKQREPAPAAPPTKDKLRARFDAMTPEERAAFQAQVKAISDQLCTHEVGMDEECAECAKSAAPDAGEAEGRTNTNTGETK